MLEVRGCYEKGMLQVPNQGIAKWVEMWSFVSMGEGGVEEADYMHFKRGPLTLKFDRATQRFLKFDRRH